ncbi:unnamed protein product, partial [Mesorhabditis spiculigera]
MLGDITGLKRDAIKMLETGRYKEAVAQAFWKVIKRAMDNYQPPPRDSGRGTTAKSVNMSGKRGLTKEKADKPKGLIKHMIVHLVEEQYSVDQKKCFRNLADLINYYSTSDPAAGDSRADAKQKCRLEEPIPRQIWEYEHKDVKLEKKLGNGEFGEVWKGQLNRKGPQPKQVDVAIKLAKGEVATAKKKRKAIMQESRVMPRHVHLQDGRLGVWLSSGRDLLQRRGQTLHAGKTNGEVKEGLVQRHTAPKMPPGIPQDMVNFCNDYIWVREKQRTDMLKVVNLLGAIGHFQRPVIGGDEEPGATNIHDGPSVAETSGTQDGGGNAADGEEKKPQPT